MQQISLGDEALRFVGALDFDDDDEGRTPRRLPAWTRPQVPVFMEMMVTQPSGVRIEFATDADAIDLEVQLTRMQRPDGMTRRAVFDLIVDGEILASQAEESGHLLRIDLRKSGQPELIPGEPGIVRFRGIANGGMRQCALWLPTSAKVTLKGMAISEGARIEAAEAHPGPLWVHHGSSISHCAEATSPRRSWPAVAAHRADANLINLGLGGNCQLDQFVARTIRDLPADIISLKLAKHLQSPHKN